MYGLLNIGSVLCGLISLYIPLSVLADFGLKKLPIVFKQFISFVLAITALILQMGYINHLINSNDWNALLDIKWAILSISSLFVFSVCILNGLVLYKSGKPKN